MARGPVGFASARILHVAAATEVVKLLLHEVRDLRILLVACEAEHQRLVLGIVVMTRNAVHVPVVGVVEREWQQRCVRAMVVLNRCQHRERDSDQHNEDD
jgi:hypothetical protein